MDLMDLKVTILVALATIGPSAVVRADSTAPQVFNVKDSGAKGDGKALDTEAIQKALDDCAKAGGGTVLFPAGTYLSKPIILKASNMAVQLDGGAKLLATDEPGRFRDGSDESISSVHRREESPRCHHLGHRDYGWMRRALVDSRGGSTEEIAGLHIATAEFGGVERL